MLPFPYFKMRARAALKGQWATALMVGLIVMLPSLIAQTVTTLQHADITNFVRDLLFDDQSIFLQPQRLTEKFLSFMTHEALLSNLLSILSWLMTPVLTLGLIHHLMNLLQGKPGAPMDAFSRIGCLVKAVVQQVYTALLIALSGLPFVVVMVLCLVFLMSPGAYPIGSILYFVAAVGLTYQIIRGTLTYAMAPYYLSETPEMGVRESVKKSKTLMEGKRALLVFLGLSFALLSLVITYGSAFIADGIHPVLGLALQMAGNLALNIYFTASVCVWFDVMKNPPAPQGVPVE